MTAFPPRQKLIHVAGCLVRRLPDRFATILAAEPFAEGRDAISRLTDPSALAAGAAEMAPEEAAWMADLLLERWSRIDTVELDPAAAILGPSAVWVSDRERSIDLGLATLGLDEGWSAEWGGDVEIVEDGRSAVMRIPPIRGGDGPPLKARVRIIGRAGSARTVVTAGHEVRCLRPVVTVSADRLALTLCDQWGEPGRRVPISVHGADHFSDDSGTVVLELPLASDAAVMVDGQPVSVIPAERR